VRLGVKETPIPSTISLSKYCYPEHNLIIKEALKLLGIKYSNKIIPKLNKSPDQPDENSFGPF
jgi:hypothetical protein